MNSSMNALLATLALVTIGGCAAQADGTAADPVESQAGASALSNADQRAIPDNNATGITSTITQNLPNQSLTRVRVNISHAWRGDLDVALIAPDGRKLELRERTQVNKNERSRDLVIDRDVWRDFGAGKQVGTWTLRVADLGRGDVGTLNGWSLDFSPVTPYNDSSSSGNGSGNGGGSSTGSGTGYGTSGAQPCNGACWYGATCSDFCPSTAYCQGTYENGSLVWHVTSCGR